jgi:MFS transporter, Spinster family, sphingosine-1-phosphate transporter
MISAHTNDSFQCMVPPFINDNAEATERGQWLAVFFTAIPVGTALGYTYGSFMAHSAAQWSGAFLIEAVVALPLVLLCFAIPRHTRARARSSVSISITAAATTVAASEGKTKLIDSVQAMPTISSSNSRSSGDDYSHYTALSGDSSTATATASTTAAAISISEDWQYCDDAEELVLLHANVPPPTWQQEVRAVLSQRTYVCIVLGYSAYVAVVVGISTFGSGFIVSLGLLSSERAASAVFGSIIACAGILGTPLGGMLLDSAAHLSDAPKLTVVLQQLLCMVCTATLFVIAAACATAAGTVPFLLLLAVGCFFLFMATSHVNMGLMLSVPKENRSFALALNTLGLHVLGDVPSPIIGKRVLNKLYIQRHQYEFVVIV